MAENFPILALSDLIAALLQKTPHPVIVQIGAMDGVRFDLMHPHLSKGGWRGLLVEPLSDMFALLEKNYAALPELKTVRAAVMDRTGSVTMRRIDPAAIEAGLVPSEALGLSTCAPSGGLIASPEFAKRYPEALAKHLLSEEVPCLTLADLLAQEGLSHVDLFALDAEGADWMIAQQIDLANDAPALICLEHTSLGPKDMFACLMHFGKAGYKTALCSEDRENLLFYKDSLLAGQER